jgi:hypothetical protein
VFGSCDTLGASTPDLALGRDEETFRKATSATGVVFVLLIALAADARAGPIAVENDGDLSLKPVIDLNQSGAGATVVGGREADSRFWQASFYPGSEGEKCSATLIGPHALLLAAHCVGDKKRVSWFKEVEYGGECRRSSKYGEPPKDPSADYALCLINPAPIIDKFETVLQDASRVKDGAEIVLTGFGCTRLPNSGGNDGIFRVTDPVKIDKTPGEPGSERNTILIQNEATVTCRGDSGSGAYIKLTSEKRVIVAVNSRAVAVTGQRQSFLSGLTTSDAKDFLEAWATDFGQKKDAASQEKICGFNFFDDGKCQ